MGQAKRRGTFEQRRQKAIDKAKHVYRPTPQNFNHSVALAAAALGLLNTDQLTHNK